MALHIGDGRVTSGPTVKGKRATLSLANCGAEPGPTAGKLPRALADFRRIRKSRGHRRLRAAVHRSRRLSNIHCNANLASPALWSPETPNLYSAIVTVESDGKPRDAERVTFGVRTVSFDADKGFLLNGKSLKIKGTCNHQDHAGVGAALPDRLQCYRLGVLKDMGCNAVRTSHKCPLRNGSKPATGWA